MGIAPQTAKLLILEDESLVADQIYDELLSELEKEGVELFRTDNLQEAAELAHSDQLRYLIADVKVKDKPESESPNADAQTFLRNLRRDGRFVTTIVHTAYPDKALKIEKAGWADITIGKGIENSTEQVIDHGKRLTQQRQGFCRTAWSALSLLREAAACEDPIDKAELLRLGRKDFGVLTTPEFAPINYRRATLWLSSFGMRLSAVPSPRFELFKVDQELVSILEPLFLKLIGTRFDYENDTLPIMMRLEALGYPVLRRVDV